MDRFRQKIKKDKPQKHADRDKSNLFIADVKAIKENLKIKEILRTVKMNSSMRVKAPRGSKVMNSKDFHDNDDFIDDSCKSEAQEQEEELTPSAMNPNVVISGLDTDEAKFTDEPSSTDINESNTDISSERTVENSNEIAKDCENLEIDDSTQTELSSQTKTIDESERSENEPVLNYVTASSDKSSLYIPPIQGTHLKSRDRKLSLDHTILTRREGLSQSELDLHLIGKSPLERKSSFFRKKMESFLKNTTEIFKKQSLGSKPQPIKRRGSMSVSLQSLNETACTNDYNSLLLNAPEARQGSMTSLYSSSTVGHSTSSLSASQSLQPSRSEQDSLNSSQPALSASQPLADVSSESIHSLNDTDTYSQAPLMSSRAISMSSGLDSAHGLGRRNSNRSKRVTWVASEGLTNYFRRVIQDEKSREMQNCQSYSDFSSIPENELYGSTLDSKGRRLSYQRAVSGEDPVMPTRQYYDSTRRRHFIPENAEANFQLSNKLAEFTRNGVPTLQGFAITIPDEALSLLEWAERPLNLELHYDWKKLSHNEEARQAVIRELVTTEADHIRHLMSVVEVFIAAAHALQDGGKMLDVDTAKLFSNIPDVLNASLYFWETALYPMLVDAIQNSTPFNTEFMAAGFCRFREIFQPYEKFVSEQTKALDYLRSLSNNTDFMSYLAWCHSHKSCNRLQLSDILVKPMQRLTKYSLILRRIIAHTETEPERTSLIAMESFAKNYVLDLNRSIRQREELEKLDALSASIDGYEIDFKDDDMDRYFRMYSNVNLRAPMVNCLPSHSRTIIHQGDLRFKDHLKEVEVRAILLTDMLLICKKMSKGSPFPFKMIRPKFMVEKMIQFPKTQSKGKDQTVSGLIYVMVDDVGSSFSSFALSESSKDSNPQATLKLWEQKIREARLTYDLGVWFARNPSRDLSEVEMDSSSDYAVSGQSATAKSNVKQISDDMNIEREARERVAAMLHRSMGASTDYDFSQASMTTDSFDGDPSGGTSGGRTPGLHSLRHPMHRTSTGGSSRNSRLSSFHKSTSAASHDDPASGPGKYNYRAGSSVEHLIPPLNPDDVVTSITVNVVSESESETVVPVPTAQPPSPLKLGPRTGMHNSLRVQPQSGVLALMHSLPDLTIEPSSPRPVPSPPPPSASEKLYQSHQELLQKNRLAATQHQYLSPDHRGTSYPPPSPSRASLKRGLAFSYSFKNPPLSKMGHVNSQTQLHAEAALLPVFPIQQPIQPVLPGPPVQSIPPVQTAQQINEPRSGLEKGALNPMVSTTPSSEKDDKKSKYVSSRHKGDGSSGEVSGTSSGTSSGTGAIRKEDKSE